MHDEDENLEDGFKIGPEEDELEIPLDGMTDFGLDEEDPDKDH